MLGNYLDEVRKKTPLVHNITNYVTANDVANIILASGGSPIMADGPEEAEAITALCGGLNLNIGTLNRQTVEGMLLAGRRARILRRPLLLDPVGAGASRFRTETALALIRETSPTVIRGNSSEIRALALGTEKTKGVDADVADAITEENISTGISFVKSFAKETGAIIAMTGEIDLVGDGEVCFVIRNGRAEMEKVTGTGCQLSGMLTAFLAASPESPLKAAAAAVCAMGLAGEIAFSRLQPGEGNIAYRGKMIDAIYNMTGEVLERGAKYEIR